MSNFADVGSHDECVARVKKASVKLNSSMTWEIGLILPLEWLRGALCWSSTPRRAKGDRRPG
jgi:hypothetical protein